MPWKAISFFQYFHGWTSFLPLVGLLLHLVALKLSLSSGVCISLIFPIRKSMKKKKNFSFHFFLKTLLCPKKTTYNFFGFFLAFMFHEIVEIISPKTLLYFPKLEKVKVWIHLKCKWLIKNTPSCFSFLKFSVFIFENSNPLNYKNMQDIAKICL